MFFTVWKYDLFGLFVVCLDPSKQWIFTAIFTAIFTPKWQRSQSEGEITWMSHGILEVSNQKAEGYKHT